jgi:UDP-N-acetyl-alpha-D-muramoyl-L-alanyl-L-glutamate epimerase
MKDPCRFDPGSVGAFRVTRRSFDEASRTVSLHYSFDDGPDFVETITFETVPARTAPAGSPGLERALLHLHIAAGTSYYKVAAPRVVVIEGGVTAPALEFHHHLYDDGLREFAVSNQLAVPRPVTLRPTRLEPPLDHPPATERPGGGRLLVPIGGGKDSMVVIDAVKHLDPLLFAVNPHPLVLELADQAGLELMVVRRTLAPNLAELNRAGALNGHVPITAIVSLIAVAGSFLYGYDTIAMAVERSASEETVVLDGTPVNHQYSKSLAFEQLLRSLIASEIDSRVRYGSALRPYSELAIARSFARLTEYHSTFCSCNTVFRQTAGAEDRWCGNCPKCRFVGLMLAPFLSPGEVARIIGRDMFDDPDQVPGFAALMSPDDKPFECVGERRESAAAVRLLSDQPGWKDTPVVVALSTRARAMVSDADVVELLTPSGASAFGGGELARALDRRLTAAP